MTEKNLRTTLNLNRDLIQRLTKIRTKAISDSRNKRNKNFSLSSTINIAIGFAVKKGWNYDKRL